MARNRKSKDEIRRSISAQFDYDFSRSTREIRKIYFFSKDSRSLLRGIWTAATCRRLKAASRSRSPKTQTTFRQPSRSELRGIGPKGNKSCRGTVPEALIAFLDSTDFEDAIRLAISLGGDADTVGYIAGGTPGPSLRTPGLHDQFVRNEFDRHAANVATITGTRLRLARRSLRLVGECAGLFSSINAT